MSDGSYGLMAPAGSDARRKYEEEQARKQGWYGLMASVAEPLSFIPGPVGDAAQVAQNVGEKGWKEGLLSSWDVLGLPKVLRKGPALLQITGKPSRVGKTVTDEMTTEALMAKFKGLPPQDIYEFSQKHPGFHLSRYGRVEHEFDPSKINFTDKAQTAMEQLIASEDPNKFLRLQMKEYLDAPELFSAYPGLEDRIAQLGYGRGGVYRKAAAPGSPSFEFKGRSVEGPRGFRGVSHHELQHFVDSQEVASANGLGVVGGADFIVKTLRGEIPEVPNLKAVPAFKALSPQEQRHYAEVLYGASHPEVRGRTAQARTYLTPREQQEIPPALEKVFYPYAPDTQVRQKDVVFLRDYLLNLRPSEKAAILAKLQQQAPYNQANSGTDNLMLAMRQYFAANPPGGGTP